MSRWPKGQRVFLAGILGACFGWMLAASVPFLSRMSPVRSEWLPYPHVVPKSEGALSLRLAMIQDVLQERFPRHGQAYYRERNRLCRKTLDALQHQQQNDRPQPAYFDLLDDLAIGLDEVGEHDEAIRVMRNKLEQQLKFKVPRAKLYSTYANLGTLLILGPFRQVRPGSEQDKQVLREGLKDIQTAVEINPDSHFGRELWQVVIIQYMIGLYDHPELLLRFDMLGNRLDLPVDVAGRSPMKGFGAPIGKSGEMTQSASLVLARVVASYLKHPDPNADYKVLRQGIATVGAEEGWANAVASSHVTPVPFDEPVLGIVGMWRLGGGAHPYFAVALGETMLRVGQPYIAWSAFERAARMAQLVWPDPKLQQQFTEHCRHRQAAIEAAILAGEVGHLRPAFDAELALGLDYQKAYQRFEEEKIAVGKSIEDPHFYDDFRAQHDPIASDVGKVDWFQAGTYATWNSRAEVAVLLAGVFSVAAALWFSRT